ncbi:MAG: hypothetical protein K0Q50_1340 [Vampirovibrio sp.]|jgi:hypothetical protein|nr:hypothetical protein [Vampirovibrio sp.]
MTELAMILAIISMLAAFGLVSMKGLAEQRDASMVQSAQANLQSIVSQGATRLDVTPKELRDSHSAQILLAIQSAVGEVGGNNGGVTFTNSGGKFTMTITSSGRQASFTISDNGDVNVKELSKFSDYKVNNGIIVKQ